MFSSGRDRDPAIRVDKRPREPWRGVEVVSQPRSARSFLRRPGLGPREYSSARLRDVSGWAPGVLLNMGINLARSSRQPAADGRCGAFAWACGNLGAARRSGGGGAESLRLEVPPRRLGGERSRHPLRAPVMQAQPREGRARGWGAGVRGARLMDGPGCLRRPGHGWGGHTAAVGQESPAGPRYCGRAATPQCRSAGRAPQPPGAPRGPKRR